MYAKMATKIINVLRPFMGFVETFFKTKLIIWLL
jgi:hypothetical protein